MAWLTGCSLELAGPPLFFRAANPFNALAELKPVRKGDAEWEPLGFQYLDYLDAMQLSLIHI